MNVKMEIDPRTMLDGVVLVISVRYRVDRDHPENPQVYTHAAIKARGQWFLTGSRAPQAAGWGAVERWLERDNRELVRVEMAIGSRTLWPVPVKVESYPMDLLSEEHGQR